MTNRQIALNWTYAITGVLLFGFLAPAMISMADTLLVIAGVVLIVLYIVWSYYFWVKPLFLKLPKDLL